MHPHPPFKNVISDLIILERVNQNKYVKNAEKTEETIQFKIDG